VGHPNEVEDEGVGWHSNSALSVRPSQELISFMLKDRCLENTLFAVTNRAGHHAIVASNTGGKAV
jgi:hypothetical protein